MARQQKALIAGGGIGGLAAAIALRQAGFDVKVFEREAQPSEIGAGVAIWPNGARALQSLGVKGGWVALKRLTLRTWDGRRLLEPPLDALQQRYGWGMIMAHRADLHSDLRGALGDGPIRAGARVNGLDQDEKRVSVLLDNGDEESGDLLVGADGLRSAVRSHLLRDGDPTYQGFTAWRAVTRDAMVEMEPDTGCNWWGRGGEFLAFPLAGRRTYWAGTANAVRSAKPGRGGHKQDVIERFRGWAEPIEALIDATEPQAVLRTDIYDRPPARHWSLGRVTLLGDAAHPMTPSQGQGACQALEDAVVLGECLVEEPDIPRALREYERRRLPRANRIVRLSRQASRAVQSESRLICRLRDTSVSLLPWPLMVRALNSTLGGPARASGS